jgi:hypothetical protein
MAFSSWVGLNTVIAIILMDTILPMSGESSELRHTSILTHTNSISFIQLLNFPVIRRIVRSTSNS